MERDMQKYYLDVFRRFFVLFNKSQKTMNRDL